MEWNQCPFFGSFEVCYEKYAAAEVDDKIYNDDDGKYIADDEKNNGDDGKYIVDHDKYNVINVKKQTKYVCFIYCQRV